jgi:hypothetical protein
MRVEIMMVTYRNDYEFAAYTLRSIKKFGSGYSGITIVTEYRDYDIFKGLAEQYDCTLRTYLPHPNKEFLHHMIAKCEADLWCPKGTEAVMHIDADCIFGEPFTMETFIHDGKPLLVREHFDDFIHHGNRGKWRINIQNNLGFDCEWECMVRHPAVYKIDMYKRFREHIEQLHRYPFTAYVVLQKNEYPQTFSEFPDMGAFILKYDAEQYRIVTICTTPSQYWSDPKWKQFGITPIKRNDRNEPIGEHPYTVLYDMDTIPVKGDLINPIRYFWSRRGVTPEYRQQIEAMLKD